MKIEQSKRTQQNGCNQSRSKDSRLKRDQTKGIHQNLCDQSGTKDIRLKTLQSKRVHENKCNQPGTKDIRLFGKKEKVDATSNDELRKLQESDLKKAPYYDSYLSISKSNFQNNKRNEPLNLPSWKRVEPIGAAMDLNTSRTSPVKSASDSGKHRWNNNFVRNGPKIDLLKGGHFRKFNHEKSKIDSRLGRIVDQKPINFYAKQHRKADPNHLPKQALNYRLHSQNITRQKTLVKDYPASTRPNNQDDGHRKMSHESINISSEKHDQSDISLNQRMSPMNCVLPSPQHNFQTGHTPFCGFFVPWQGSSPFIFPSEFMSYYLAPTSQDNLGNDTSSQTSDGSTSRQQFFPAALARSVFHVGSFLYLVVGYVSVALCFR